MEATKTDFEHSVPEQGHYITYIVYKGPFTNYVIIEGEGDAILCRAVSEVQRVGAERKLDLNGVIILKMCPESGKIGK